MFLGSMFVKTMLLDAKAFCNLGCSFPHSPIINLLACCFGVYARALLVPICRLHCFIPCLNHISKVNNVTDNHICFNHLQWDTTITAQNLSTATLFVEIIGATG
jgi:hypothetical protein